MCKQETRGEDQCVFELTVICFFMLTISERKPETECGREKLKAACEICVHFMIIRGAAHFIFLFFISKGCARFNNLPDFFAVIYLIIVDYWLVEIISQRETFLLP